METRNREGGRVRCCLLHDSAKGCSLYVCQVAELPPHPETSLWAGMDGIWTGPSLACATRVQRGEWWLPQNGGVFDAGLSVLPSFTRTWGRVIASLRGSSNTLSWPPLESNWYTPSLKMAGNLSGPGNGETHSNALFFLGIALIPGVRIN